MNETQPLRVAARELARLRQRPCLVLAAPALTPETVRAVRTALGDRCGELDVVLRSPGGCLCCAYQIARELRRRCARLAVFVPLAAKSAATLIALAADELVLGALGPLDAQFSDRQQADFPVDRSRLEVLRALELLQQHAIGTFDALVRTVAENSGMRGADVCRIGTEFAARVCQPLYAQLAPQAVGQSLRAIDMTVAYSERVLRRYRPDLYAQNGPLIVERLVKSYPDHGFVIDREELDEIGIPARAPSAAETAILDGLASALAGMPAAEIFIECVEAVGRGDTANTTELSEDSPRPAEPC